MKTDTREYDDGTEPDVYRRWCCDGKCEQGRLCPKHMPAEAASDVGQEPDFYSMNMMLEETAKFALAVVAVSVVIIVVSFLAGRYL